MTTFFALQPDWFWRIATWITLGAGLVVIAAAAGGLAFWIITVAVGGSDTEDHDDDDAHLEAELRRGDPADRSDELLAERRARLDALVSPRPLSGVPEVPDHHPGFGRSDRSTGRRDDTYTERTTTR